MKIKSNIVIDETLNHHLCGGNKIRKLGYILKNKEKYDGFITFGSKFSSHCLATAFMGRKKNKKVVLLITNKFVDIYKFPNLKLAKELGAEIFFIGEDNLYHEIKIKKNKYKNFFWIEGGGHTIEGFYSYRDWFKQIVTENKSLKKFKYLILPFGTGTTAFGITQAIYEMKLDIKVIGISVSRKKNKCDQEASKMLSDKAINFIEIDDRFAGQYGQINLSQRNISLNFFKKYHIYPDPIYNIRVAQYLEDNPLENCIIINTGGQLNCALKINYEKGFVE
ncbi:pyridoxal-phosphate dependent enzyme [Candidatus Pelagibacter bacterium nBUS_49]|uniref:pyridoxal-phosphate dependent enzyme n=1 Tax=Candidatus Pelagibacter bacterium nBUS_49 TaxID=3374196 RepID=UPI003EB7CEA4